jgi:hypothetical protein
MFRSARRLSLKVNSLKIGWFFKHTFNYINIVVFLEATLPFH